MNEATEKGSDTAAASRELRRDLQKVADEVRAEHPWLAHQDAVGFGIFALSVAAIVGLAVAYGYGVISAWVVIPAAAFAMSLLHELEHDLIHRLYFKDRPWVIDLMMGGVWLLRPSTVNPWTRRALHLHHHKVSGTESDMEERSITNGVAWGLRRLLMTADGMLAIFLNLPGTIAINRAFVRAQRGTTREERRALRRALSLSYVPLGLVHYALWHAYLVVLSATALSAWVGVQLELPAWLEASMGAIEFLVVVLLAPNVLRSFCLHFVSSNIHYYGDVQPRNLIEQVQVWTSPWALPVQLFCFNFGGTHAIHHFVVQEPFYLRQMAARRCYPLMRAKGVRFDDFGTFRRANRWGRAPEGRPEVAPAASRRLQPQTG